MLTVSELEDPVSAVTSRTDWKREIPPGTDFVIRRSKHVWSINDGDSTLLIFGLYEPTLLSDAELWLLMPEGFSTRLRRNIRFAREYVHEMLHEHPLLRAHSADAVGARFLRAMGFNALPSESAKRQLWELRA